jgi:hypothetical protein
MVSGEVVVDVDELATLLEAIAEVPLFLDEPAPRPVDVLVGSLWRCLAATDVDGAIAARDRVIALGHPVTVLTLTRIIDPTGVSVP